MEKVLSLIDADSARMDRVGSNSGSVNELFGQAETNGRHANVSHLVHSILPPEQFTDLEDEQARKRNQLVKSVLKRFDQVLTPPVPPDVERYIRLKDQCDWLPWEEEVIAKVGRWRSQLKEMGPELMEDLSQTVRAIRNY